MPISLARAHQHVDFWCARLSGTSRAKWPKHLFHTCQLEVAVEILKANKVICRNKVDHLICDVANQGALWNNPESHKFVRLYFRPRTFFHLKTEGVKSIGDPYRVDPHMSVPVAFAFDFTKVLTDNASGFVDGNFARNSSAVLTGDEEFDKLDFNWIYHDSGLPRDRINEINNIRMSEVVYAGDLSLSMLSAVVCRTTHEEKTLRHMLAGVDLPQIVVEQKSSIFMRTGAFVDEISWTDGELNMEFHGPTRSAKELYDIRVEWVHNHYNGSANYRLAAGKRYRFPDVGGRKRQYGPSRLKVA